MSFSKSLMVSTLCVVAVLLAFCASPAEARTRAALRCPAGYSRSFLACRLPATQADAVAGAGICCSCPPGSFSDGTSRCSRCVDGSVAQSGVDLQRSGAQCSCLPGFGDYDATTMTCRRCPANYYSSGNRCVACAPGTFAAAQSTSCAAVKCPDDSYLPAGGSVLADCVRCRFGTAGQACGTVMACRCLSGFAGFDATNGQCQQCPSSNSIAVYSDSSKPDETKTTCMECPIGYIASEDRRTCVPKVTKVTALVSDPAKSIPANPIPSLACADNGKCSNGFDILAGYFSAGDAFPDTKPVRRLLQISVPVKAAALVSVGHDADIYSASDRASIRKFARIRSDRHILLIDVDGSNTIVGSLTVTSDGIYLNGQNSYRLQNINGFTCDQANQYYDLHNNNKPTTKSYRGHSSSGNYYTCISVPRSATPVDIMPLLKEQGKDFSIQSGFQLQVSIQCGQSAVVPACPNKNYAVTFEDISYNVDSLGKFVLPYSTEKFNTLANTPVAETGVAADSSSPISDSKSMESQSYRRSVTGPFDDNMVSPMGLGFIELAGTGLMTFTSNQGIAICDANDMIQFVILTPVGLMPMPLVGLLPDQLAGNGAVSYPGNAAIVSLHPAIGGKCTTGTGIAAVVRPSVQGISLTDVVNSIVPGSIPKDNIHKLYALCNNNLKGLQGSLQDSLP